MKAYVKYETPGDVKQKALEAVEMAKAGLRKGTNETTKAIERGEARLVVIAEDVDPEEIVMHLPLICLEKKAPFVYVATKAALGKAAGLVVGTSAVAITKPGAGEALLKEILQKISGMAPGADAAPKVEKQVAAKAPAKKKEKKEEKKEEKKSE